MKQFRDMVLAELSIAFMFFGVLTIVISAITSDSNARFIGIALGVILFLSGLLVLKSLSKGSAVDGTISTLLEGIFTVW